MIDPASSPRRPPVAPVQVVEADLTWIGERFESGVRIRIDADGRIEAVGRFPEPPTLRLAGAALLPGMVNAHSHAFQRGLRGQGERFPEGAGSFWSWREAMYGLVNEMDEERVFELSRHAFSEMLAVGITTVGEFHYLHHDASEAGYRFDELVMQAAAEAGIRLVLLNAYYRRGGFQEELIGGQRRFGTPDLESYWRQMDRLQEMMDGRQQRLGAVAHSVRAAPIEEIEALCEEAERRHLVVHMHVEEQPKEIEDCLRAYGKTPLALLNERLDISPAFTAVHLTHSAEADLDDFLAAGGNVCLCPLTEANLGDGVPRLRRMLRAPEQICLGTDSNARICFMEEMRWLEYAHRLFGQTRGVCRENKGQVARALWSMATLGGARALGLRAGSIEPGLDADLMVIDLDRPCLWGVEDEWLLEALILGTGNEAVTGTCVGGQWKQR